MSQRRAHIRAVVFHTPHRGLRNTRLCPYVFTFTMPSHVYSRHSSLPHVNWRPPRASLQVTSPYSLLFLVNRPNPPPPSLSALSHSPLPSFPLRLHSVPRLTAAVDDSKPSLTSHLRRDPANAWLAAPDSARLELIPLWFGIKHAERCWEIRVNPYQGIRARARTSTVQRYDRG